MWTKTCTFLIIIFCVIVRYNVTYAKRILVISNLPSYSHQISYRGLWLELHKQGHEIVSVTTNPIQNSSLINYTEIDINYFYNGFPEYKSLPYLGSTLRLTTAYLNLPFLEAERNLIWFVGHILNQELYKDPEMKKLYAIDSNEHFDAVIVAQGPTISLNALAYRFNAPLIGISSLDVFNHLRYTFGSLILPSHISNWQINKPNEKNMSFWRRLVNFYDVWKQMYSWMNEHVAMEDAIAKKYLGEDLPHINDITRNMSIFLVNRHPAFVHGKPEQPNVIYYYGSHIAKVPDALPKNVKQFLDDAKEGFIYVSLGSNVKWEELPNNTLEAFVDGFSTLPYKIVWKLNPDLLPRKYKNILMLQWFPQQSILAHPNIKLFIYQGGLQSTEEALYYGIPLIGFPIIWDQTYQVRNIVRLGIGVHLQIDTISKETVKAAIHEVISNTSYKDQMQQWSKIFKDSPYDSLQNAVRWIEYVIRQNGTPFLRNNLCDDPWYERYDWDIIGFLAILLFIVFLISIWALLLILRFHLRIISRSLWHSRISDKMLKITCKMFIVLSLWFLLANNITNAGRILVIIPTPIYSHQIVFQSLCLALNRRGHELIIATPQPIKDSTLTNYTEIELSLSHSLVKQYKKNVPQLSLTDLLKLGWTLTHKISIPIYDNPKLKKLYHSNSNEKFDAVILELVGYPSLSIMSYRFNAPLIGIISMGIHNYHRYVFGSPIYSSHLSNWEINTLTENPSIWQRLWNFIETWHLIHFWINDFITMEQGLVKKHFGNDAPHIVDIIKNMSLLLVNENPVLTYPRPEQSNAIFFNGIHIQKTPPSLPKVSHPNIKIFIYQGGAQSTDEAVHYAVPLLGIPNMSEQENRVRRLVSLGVAISIKLNELTQERLNNAIHQIFNDKSYKEKMMRVSSLSKDQPYNSIENVIWWIEYVMRHKGANHLRFSDSDKPWYQRYDMDIIALFAIALFIMECIIALTIIQIIRFTLNNIALYSCH
ncbi:Ecdysteroid UDP-glucosyltransferase [Atta colombica]|uniref:Ecdysteroid UDP-glucosyltransferase n=1 Tax=Atta colombica TaxID=520822 RepID=A0A195B090_9HYME|nr:Ecdysteroid UDP-glucosyltransferase [Atta colombica]